jgi:exodeoxyribonuclease VII small subunit
MPRARTQSQGFEESLAALEKIVTQLETGDLPLERALEIFEDGVGLARRCQSQLADAERKVELLLREHGELKVVPFDPARGDQALAGAAQSPQIRRPTEAERRAPETDDFDDDADEPDETGDDVDDDQVPF